MAVTFTLEKYKTFPVLKIEGEVMGVESKKFKNKMEYLYNQNHKIIIVDIKDTAFMDSDGLGVLVYYHTLLSKSNKELVLYNEDRNPDGYMNKMLDFTRLIMVFKVVHSLTAIA